MVRALGPWRQDEYKVLGWLLLAIVVWATDFWHHLSAAAVGVTISLLLTLPGMGVLDLKAIKGVNFWLIVFAGGVVSMANVLITVHALAPLVTLLSAWHEALLSNAWRASLTLYWGGFLYHFLVGSEFTMVSTLLPVLLNVASTQEYNLTAMGMLWVFAGGGKLFLYQNTALIFGYSYGFFTTRDLLKVGAVLTVVEGLLIMVLVPLYWPLIGLSWTTPSAAQHSVPAEAVSVDNPGATGLAERPQQRLVTPPLAIPAPTVPVILTPSPALDPETAAWARVRHATTPQALAEFLAAFPATRFAFAARRRLRQLQQPPSALPAVDPGPLPGQGERGSIR
jgi:hypothetical protein